jgi:hypothetical protein
MANGRLAGEAKALSALGNQNVREASGGYNFKI